MKVEHTEVIDRPIAAVWKLFEAADRFVEWQGNLLEFEVTEGRYDRVGGVAEMRVKQTGMTNDMTATVLERDARRHTVTYGYEGAQAPFEIANSFRSTDGGGTEWTAVLDLKLNFLTRALAPVLKPLASDLVKNNGREFREFCESEL